MNIGELPKGEINLSNEVPLTGREAGIPNGLENLDASVTELMATLDELVTRLDKVLLEDDERKEVEEPQPERKLSAMSAKIITIHDKVLLARTGVLRTLQRLDI